MQRSNVGQDHSNVGQEKSQAAQRRSRKLTRAYFRFKSVISQDTKRTDRTILLKIFGRLGNFINELRRTLQLRTHSKTGKKFRDVCVGMRALSCGFNCLIRAYSQLHGYSHDTNTQSAGQWRARSRAVATQNIGSGGHGYGQWRRKT